MKKIIITITILSMLVFLAVGVVLASTKIDLGISSSQRELKSTEEAILKVSLENYEGIKEGINCYKATLEYDEGIFETIGESDIKCQNNWEGLQYNQQTKELVAIKKAGTKEQEEILQITLKVKEGVKANKTTVKLKDIVTSEGKEDIAISEVGIDFDIIEEQGTLPEEPDKKDSITSDKYKIEAPYIQGILPETTVNTFKQNVETQSELVFLNSQGETLEEGSIITTGVQLKVGTTLQYTLIVKGDIDEDGKITVNDLACAKLHLIDHTLLTGIKLKAADVDTDNEITINDIAQYKLILLDLLELK